MFYCDDFMMICCQVQIEYLQYQNHLELFLKFHSHRKIIVCNLDEEVGRNKSSKGRTVPGDKPQNTLIVHYLQLLFAIGALNSDVVVGFT